MTGPKAMSRDQAKALGKGNKAAVAGHGSGVGRGDRRGHLTCTLPRRHLSCFPHVNQAGDLARLPIHSGVDTVSLFIYPFNKWPLLVGCPLTVTTCDFHIS